MKLLKTYPFPEEIIKAGVEEIERVLKESTKGKDWKRRAQKIYEAAKESIGVRVGQKSAKIKLRMLLEEIELLTKQIQELEEEMKKMVEETEEGEYIECARDRNDNDSNDIRRDRRAEQI